MKKLSWKIELVNRPVEAFRRKFKIKQYLLNILFMTPKTNCVEVCFTYKKMSPLKSTLH